MARLLNVVKSREAGEEVWEDVSEDLVQERLEMLDDRNVPLWMPHQGLGLPMVFSDGAAGQIKGSDFWEAKAAGGRYETSKERDARWLREEIQKSPIKATAAAMGMAFGRGASFNATTVAASATVGNSELRDALISEHPYSSILAELGGVGVTTLASMGTTAPAAKLQMGRTFATAAKFIPGIQGARLTTAAGRGAAKLLGKGVTFGRYGKANPIGRGVVANSVAESIVGGITAGAVNASLDSAMYTSARELGNLIEDKPGWSAEGALANIAHDALWGGVFGGGIPGGLALSAGMARTGGKLMQETFYATTGNRISRAGGRMFARVISNIHGLDYDDVVFAWSLTRTGLKNRKIQLDEALQVAADPRIRARIQELQTKLHNAEYGLEHTRAAGKVAAEAKEAKIISREGRKRRIDEHWDDQAAIVQSSLNDLDNEAINLSQRRGPIERGIEELSESKAGLTAEAHGVRGEYRADLRNAKREIDELAEEVADELKYKPTIGNPTTKKFASEPQNIINAPEEVTTSIATRAKGHFETFVDNLDEAYSEWGGAGKQVAMQRASRMPALHIDDVRAQSKTVLMDITKILEEGAPGVNPLVAANLRKKANAHVAFALDELQGATTHGEVHEILNKVKRYVGHEVFLDEGLRGSAYRRAAGHFKGRASRLRDYLESAEIWGDEVAALQKSVNAPMSDTATLYKTFKQAFYDTGLKKSDVQKLENYIKHFGTSKSAKQAARLDLMTSSAHQLGIALQAQKGSKMAEIGKRLVKSSKALAAVKKEAKYAADVKNFNRQLIGDVFGGGPMAKNFTKALNENPFFISRQKLTEKQRALTDLKKAQKKLTSESQKELQGIQTNLRKVNNELKKLKDSKAAESAIITLKKKKATLEKKQIAAKKKALRREQAKEISILRADKKRIGKETERWEAKHAEEIAAGKPELASAIAGQEEIATRLAVGEGAYRLGATKPGPVDLVSVASLGLGIWGTSALFGALIGTTIFAARKPAQFATQTAHLHSAISTTYNVIDDKLVSVIDKIAEGKVRVAEKGAADPLSTFAGWLAGATMAD